MPILNAQFTEALRAGLPLRLNLGSGGKVKPGYWGVDLLDMPGVDVQARDDADRDGHPASLREPREAAVTRHRVTVNRCESRTM